MEIPPKSCFLGRRERNWIRYKHKVCIFTTTSDWKWYTANVRNNAAETWTSCHKNSPNEIFVNQENQRIFNANVNVVNYLPTDIPCYNRSCLITSCVKDDIDRVCRDRKFLTSRNFPVLVEIVFFQLFFPKQIPWTHAHIKIAFKNKIKLNVIDNQTSMNKTLFFHVLYISLTAS